MKNRKYEVVVLTVCAAALAGALLGALIADWAGAGNEPDGEERREEAGGALERVDTGRMVDVFAGVDRRGQHGVCEFCGQALDGTEDHVCPGGEE